MPLLFIPRLSFTKKGNELYSTFKRNHQLSPPLTSFYTNCLAPALLRQTGFCLSATCIRCFNFLTKFLLLLLIRHFQVSSNFQHFVLHSPSGMPIP